MIPRIAVLFLWVKDRSAFFMGHQLRKETQRKTTLISYTDLLFSIRQVNQSIKKVFLKVLKNRNAIIKQALNKPSRQEQLYNYDDKITLYINLPYMGNAREQLVKSCI